MSQWGFYFNQNRCVGCKSCTLACKVWNEKRRGDVLINVGGEENIKNNPNYYQPDEMQYEPSLSYIDKTGANNYAEMRKYYMKEDWRKVHMYDKGTVTVDEATNAFSTTFDRSYVSLGCNHCDDPACLKVCPMGVYYKEEKYGLTLYDTTGCISCGRCVAACPWGVPQFYAEDYTTYKLDDPARPRMTKCTGCYDRLEESLKPACVAACWHRALDFGPIDELKTKYNGDYVMELPEFSRADGTRPQIIFRPKKNKIS